MSRILRRPMFRGGPVSSYGKGIAAPLVPGYAGGGQIGGGIIYGKPMADGRYGFALPKQKNLFNVEDSLEELTVGSELGHLTAPTFESPSTVNEVALEETGKIDEVDTTGEEEVVNTTDEYITVPKRTRFGKSDETTVIKNPNYEAPTKTVTVGRDKTEVQVPLSDDEIAVQESLKKDFHPGQVMNTKENIEANGNDNFEITPEVDARTAVAENKALFADLLGADKARGQDISDMLLGFAGAEGEGWDKFQRFAAAESQRPGRRQKIQDAAGTLAIQDYIAGKRSKEQIGLMKERETFKLDEQLKRLYPQADDDWLTAVRKSAGKDDSYSSSKVLKKALAGKFDTPLINPDQTKKDLAEISKDKEDFAIGFTIVTLKDGRKVIIEKTETDILVRTDLPVF